MFRPLTCLFMATAVAAAQAPSDLFEKAPPEIDRALRERAARFYQAHVDGQFRKAEALIVEDSKDF
ncbi:MAG: hypothetical protein FJW37_10065, partial [Acidobacteria bacterium]|nr:hypothetical protein [Acidobacteriota bacterium]